MVIQKHWHFHPAVGRGIGAFQSSWLIELKRDIVSSEKERTFKAEIDRCRHRNAMLRRYDGVRGLPFAEGNPTISNRNFCGLRAKLKNESQVKKLEPYQLKT